MPFAGGTFNRIYSWQADALNGIDISSTRMDAEMNGMATGLSTCILKDGSQTVTADIPWGGKKITGLGAGTASTDAANLGQIQANLTYLNTVAGTNTITASASPAITAYTEGQALWFKAANANTGATTINVNGLGAKNIFKNGATGPVAMTGGEIAATNEVFIIYDGTQFQIVNPKNPLTTETTIVAASTTDLGTLASNIASVTGTTTITAFGSSASVANPLYFLRFTAALTLTYNATSLILPSAADITTVAGDFALAKYEGSGNWRILSYVRSDGTPVGGAKYKVGLTTRDVSLASGSQAVTGVGFKPKCIDFIVNINGTVAASWGFDDGTTAEGMLTNNGGTAGQFSSSTSSIFIVVSAGNTYTGKISSLDADGFTIAWTKSGSPTGTAQVIYKAYR